MSVRGLWIGMGTVLTFALPPAVYAGLKDADCLECHADRTLMKTNAAGRGIFVFVDSGRLAASAHKTNSCASCHSDITDNHPDDGIAAKLVDCHRCHRQAAQDLAASVHGRASTGGVRETPTCTDCHSGHYIESLKQGDPSRSSAAICSRCHASERINTKFNLPPDRVTTFFESYHGLAGAYGSPLVANCASCHGYHRILPSTDPDSTIHPAHLVQTCGQCHPGATEKFALSRIHVNLQAANSGSDLGSQINWWVRRIYLLLIVTVVGGMLAHNLLLLIKKVKAHLGSEGRAILRMSPTQRWQHAVLALSFIVLALTGFALKWPDSWLAVMLGSSESIRRWTHRIAGVVLILVGLYHLIYVFRTRQGWQLVKDLCPTRKDLSDVLTSVRYLSGLRKEKPKIGRFGYAEKMEYWAVVWGTIIMGVTGLIVWFKMEITQWLPRWVVDVALTIHYYEAILACLAIIVWHFYHVMFDPDVYPLNLACWDGKVSKHWHDEEHPLEEVRPSGGPQPAGTPEVSAETGKSQPV